MKTSKKSKIINWMIFLLLYGFYINLIAQGNLNSEGNTTTGTDYPKIVSSDIDSSAAEYSGFVNWEDGSKYEGEFRFGAIHGKGKLTLADGTYYDGGFEDGTFFGQGKMIYEDGSIYIGEWLLGYREGEGSMIYPDGTEYLGAFKEDLMHGEGAMILSSGESYSGFWEYGQTHGYGEITRVDGSVYSGMNEEGSRHGPGMIVWESGDTLHGSWEGGKLNEEGIFQFADGSTMISYWEKGIMKDENKYIKSDGGEYAASTKELANEVLQDSWRDGETVERNFGLAFYAIGSEYKSTMDYERAKEHLSYAAQFSDFMDNDNIKEMVENQLANIETEKERNAGVARSNEKDN